MSIAETLSKFTRELRHESIPQRVRVRAKHLILDALGIAFASGKYAFAQRTLEGLRQLGTGDSNVFGFPDTLSLRDAVVMNGLLIHGLDYDDTYLPGSMHVTASTVPTASAVAARQKRTGEELLSACIIGFEAAARLAAAGKGGFQKSGFHATGVCASFSSALVAGRLLNVDADQLTMAQGIALSTASGTMQPLRDGSWTKRMHPGWAANAGVAAAFMARGGFIGPSEAYEGHFGFYPTYLGAQFAHADLASIGHELGETWQLERISIKLYPAGHLTHAFMTATLALIREHAIAAGEVASVRALVGEGAIPLVCEPVALKRRPTSGYMAQFSLQYALACCIARGRFGLRELEQETLDDPVIHTLADKVTYEVDPQAGFPRLRSGEIIIRTRDGAEHRQREVIDPDHPEANDAIVAKFMDNACLVMPEERASAIRDRVLAIEREADASRIVSALAGPFTG
ncbi:MAG: MmgE/PrpD family protein [Burkholderiales bacterium]|nr:MmgE/PrpD family protein [Burkholderiales bacterium]